MATAPECEPPVQVAKVLRVVRQNAGGARLYIDGVLFPYATIEGFTIAPRKGELPSVTLALAAWRVELVDDIERIGAAVSQGDAAAVAAQAGTGLPGPVDGTGPQMGRSQ